MSKLEKIEADYKEAFYVLACLVNGGEFDEAKKYVASFLRRPTWRAVDPPTAWVNGKPSHTLSFSNDVDPVNSAGN